LTFVFLFRLLSDHKHRIFDQARLLAGDLTTRMNDNRLMTETNPRLLPDALTTDRMLSGTGKIWSKEQMCVLTTVRLYNCR